MGFIKKSFDSRWPNATIYWEYGNSISRQNSPSGYKSARNAISLAMDEYESKTGIKFEKRTDQRDFIIFENSDIACYVHGSGRREGGHAVNCQMLSGNSRAVSISLMHEIGHKAGLIHEHRRPDRDQFVTVGAWEQFVDFFNGGRNYGINNDEWPVFGYDLSSAMHYAGTGISRNDGVRLVRNGRLSSGDVKTIRHMYPSRKVFGDKWADGWTNFSYFKMNGEHFLIETRPSTAKLAIDKIIFGKKEPSQDRVERPLRTQEVFRSANEPIWSHTVSVVLDGKPHVVLHDQKNRKAELREVLAGGKGLKKIWEKKNLPETYHGFVLVPKGLDQFILMHSRDNGQTAFMEVSRSKSASKIVKTRRPWSKEWSHFTAFEEGSRTFLFSHQTGTGRTAFDEVLDPRTASSRSLYDVPWSSGWSHFVPYRLKGSPTHLLHYKATEGRLDVCSWDAATRDTDPVARANIGGHWSSYVGFEHAGVPYFFRYRAMGGKLEIHQLF